MPCRPSPPRRGAVEVGFAPGFMHERRDAAHAEQRVAQVRDAVAQATETAQSAAEMVARVSVLFGLLGVGAKRAPGNAFELGTGVLERVSRMVDHGLEQAQE